MRSRIFVRAVGPIVMTLLSAAVQSCAPASGSTGDDLSGPDVLGEGVSGSVPAGTELRATGNVNLRATASTSGKVLDVVSAGSKVTVVTPDPSNGFYNVSHDGIVGWSSGKYYEPTGGVSGTQPTGTVLTATGDVNLRSGPGTTYSVIGVVSAGSSVTLLDPNPTSGFYHIDDAGTAGWSSSKFFTTGGSVQSDVLTYQLTHAAYPGSGHPDVAVHLPPGFDANDRPSLIAFFHGFDNCVKVAIGSKDASCTPGGATRIALHLAEQLDAAKVNAILVAVELVFDAQSGAPGKLANTGEFRAMIDELLSQHLNAVIGTPLGVDSFDHVVVATHSGGYTAVAKVLDQGGVEIDEVELFDSLYGQYASYRNWISNDVQRFDPKASSPKRFSNIWTTDGGTLSLSVQLEQEVKPALTQAGLASSLYYQSSTANPPTADDLASPLVFSHSGLTHYGVPLNYFGKCLAASGIAKLP